MALAPSLPLLGVPSSAIMRSSISALVAGVVSAQIAGDHGVDVVHGLQDALAQIAPLVAVAQFHRLVLARGGAGGNGGAAKGAVAQEHVRFHRGIAA